MQPSPEKAHAPGHLEEREGHIHGDSNPKLGRRIKAAASSIATKLHIPGSGHSSSPGLPAVEHHRVSAQHVSSETEVQHPQWQVEEPHHQLQQQEQHQNPQKEQHYEMMPPTPATPLRESEKELATATHKPVSHIQEAETPVSSLEKTPPEEEKDVLAPGSSKDETHLAASTSSAQATPGSEYAGLELSQISNKEDPHHGAGSPVIPTPFSGIASPQRLSSDTDEMKPAYIKPLPSLDRSTESQEVYVEDLETLAEDRERGGGSGGVGGRKSAAQRLKHAGPALQPPVQEEEEGEEEEEQHTHAGPSPLYTSYEETPQQKSVKEVEPVVATASGGAALASVSLSTKEHEQQSSLETEKEEEKQEEREQEKLEDEIYAAVGAEE
jgi:hypothetical protein